jgi:hypothetical protein
MKKKRKREADKSHPEYRKGQKDYTAFRNAGVSNRLIDMIAASAGIHRREIYPPDDSRYGWVTYCAGFCDARESK